MPPWNALYHQSQSPALTPDEHIQLLLEAACDALNVEMGIVSQIKRPQPRPEGFSDSERAFMQMTGQAISMALELQQKQATAG